VNCCNFELASASFYSAVGFAGYVQKTLRNCSGLNAWKFVNFTLKLFRTWADAWSTEEIQCLSAYAMWFGVCVYVCVCVCVCLCGFKLKSHVYCSVFRHIAAAVVSKCIADNGCNKRVWYNERVIWLLYCQRHPFTHLVSLIVYPMHWIDPQISFFRLSVCVFVNRSVDERLRPQFFTDFHEILHAAQKCRRIIAYCLWDKPEVVCQFLRCADSDFRSFQALVTTFLNKSAPNRTHR